MANDFQKTLLDSDKEVAGLIKMTFKINEGKKKALMEMFENMENTKENFLIINKEILEELELLDPLESLGD